MKINLKKVNTYLLLGLGLSSLILSSCVSQKSRSVETPVVIQESKYKGEKQPIVVMSFENDSDYQRGVFSDDEDKMGDQAKTILKSHLQQTKHFKVMDRKDLEKMKEEAEILGMEQKVSGARYAVSGSVSEFGRKVTGNYRLFGLLGRSVKQIAYANITLTVTDVLTSEVVYSIQGAGEYELSASEFAGFGSKSSYDFTLNGKVLNFAITEAVNKLITNLDKDGWNQ